MELQDAPTQCLRADAARNRQLLVDAARDVFVERGLDAALDEIARRAGVGNATLYRRFPRRHDLIAAVFLDTMRDVVAAAEAALRDPDPWAGFAGHVEFLCSLQAGDRALADLLTSSIGGAPELEALRGRAFAGVVALIDQAQAAGVLRPDFRHQDLVLLLMANAGLVQRTGPAAPDAWRRHLGYVLAGLRSTVPVPAGPAPAAVHAAMTDLAGRLGCSSA
jgi:AcrR family transcriptional regulator